VTVSTSEHGFEMFVDTVDADERSPLLGTPTTERRSPGVLAPRTSRRISDASASSGAIQRTLATALDAYTRACRFTALVVVSLELFSRSARPVSTMITSAPADFL